MSRAARGLATAVLVSVPAVLPALLPGCGGGAGEVAAGGGPDLVVDRERLVRSLAPGFAGGPEDVVDTTPVAVLFAPDDCALDPDEGLVGGAGVRRLLRFATLIWNLGDRDLVVGSPVAPVAPWTPADFHHSPCHGHVHFTAAWVEYRLVDGTGAVAGWGHKQGFCIEDAYDADGRWVRGLPGRYGCEHMGISAGYGDLYPEDLPGQWIDVTDVPPGEYDLEVDVNPDRDPRFGESEARLGNNVTSVRVRLP